MMDSRILILGLSLALVPISFAVLVVVVMRVYRSKQHDSASPSQADVHAAEEPAPRDPLEDPQECPFEVAEETSPEWLSEPIRPGRWNPDSSVAPEPAPEPAPPPAAPTQGSEREGFVPVAPIEMWFGEARVGVKAGSRTYSLLTGYAQTLLDDLKRVRQGD